MTGECDPARDVVKLDAALWEAVCPHSMGRGYMNFRRQGEDRVRADYGTTKYERLRALKRKYDPTNFLRMNQNIVTAALVMALPLLPQSPGTIRKGFRPLTR